MNSFFDFYFVFCILAYCRRYQHTSPARRATMAKTAEFMAITDIVGTGVRSLAPQVPEQKGAGHDSFQR
jgi:hypothetical protein